MIFLLQILLGILIIAFEFLRKKSKLIDIVAIFNLLFFICYVISPICGYFMLRNWQDYSVMRYTIKGADYISSSFFYTGITIIVSYLVFILVYTFYTPNFRNKFLNTIFVEKIQQQRIFKYALFIFGISFISVLISSLSSGGLVNWIVANPRLYFTDEADSVKASSWGLDKLTQLMLFSCYLFWGLYKISSNKQNQDSKGLINRNLVLLFLIISFFFSAAVAIHSGGRLFFFKFFATFLIAQMYLNRKSISLLKVGSLVIFGGIIALYGRLVFKYFIYKDFVEDTLSGIDDTLSSKFFGFINNYTYAFNSANNNIKYGSDNIHLFGDLFTWPFEFFPPSIRPDGLPYTTKINTFRLMDLKDQGIIPSDFISYGIINGHVVGVLIVSALFAIVVKILNSYSYKINNAVAAILFVAMAFVIGFRVMYFDPAHLFKGSFDLIAGLIGFVVVSNFKNIKT